MAEVAPPATFRGMNAATGAELEPGYESSAIEDIGAACAAAEAAFDAFRDADGQKRARLLEAIAEEVLALGDALLERAHLETGLPLTRLAGERGRTVAQLRLFAELVKSDSWRGVRIDPAQPERSPAPRPDLRLRMVPLGPVAVFGASNFPLAFSTAGGDTASALSAGCPVVVKGHPAHPGTDLMVAGAIQQAVAKTGLPKGIFGHVRGPGHELGAALVRDRRIAAVGFTGSRSGGLALMRLCQERDIPIPVYAEMSSINPVIILPKALASRGATLGQEFVQSLTLGAGQFCTNPGLVLAIDGPGLDRFIESAAAALEGHAPQPMLTGGIRQAYTQGTSALRSHPAVRALARGLEGDGKTREMAQLFATDAKAFVADPSLGEEVFGASSLIVRCSSPADLRKAIARLEGQLTITLQMDDGDADDARPLLSVLERKAGRLLANGWPTGVEVGHAMVHGGPYPATSDSRSTSVGTLAIDRFLRPVCYQDFPPSLLPLELRDDADVPKLVNGKPA